MAGTHALGGHVTVQTVTEAVTAAQTVINTVLATIYVPNKATILDVILTTTDMDTGTPIMTLDVGDAAGPATPDDNRFIDDFAASAAGSIRASDSAGLLSGTYTYRGLKGTDDSQVEQAIQCTVHTAPTTAAAGTVKMSVSYFVAQ
jgi:hypothetical protein